MASQPSQPQSIETAHQDMIHDAQLDYYGKRLATCSSDRTVKVFDVADAAQAGAVGAGAAVPGQAAGGKSDVLRGHDGPVWQVAWAHPKFGSILASCSYDGRVFIWKEVGAGEASPEGWNKIKEHSLHSASVNAIAWAPHELGPVLACASSDGKVSVLVFNNDGTWDASLFSAHKVGVTSVSWAPSVLPGSLTSPSATPNPSAQGASSAAPVIAGGKRIVTGGCDSLVRIWAYREETKEWQQEEVLEGHTDWVRDVAWSPNIGLPRSYIASASQDKTVLIHTQDAPGGAWSSAPLPVEGGRFPDVVWRVSWSLSGNVLAVSSGDGKVTLWKENLKGAWEIVSDVTA